ncbi:unannotated protein [freshwater metagenome]|uniref:Unannotated protein n=1 Tax=freshwater metagenome TaxID=449393 RepID=A0A6J6EWV0_9ZZZZ
MNLKSVVGEHIERSLAAIGEGLRGNDRGRCALTNSLGQRVDHLGGGERALEGIGRKHNLH